MRLEKSCNGHAINWIKYEKVIKCRSNLNPYIRLISKKENKHGNYSLILM